jgi:hypothetical protein
MAFTHRDQPIPLHVYHGVPKGWYAGEIVTEYLRLGGTSSLLIQQATEPGAPTWLPERNEWLQYRATLYRVADGIVLGDSACVELALRYILLNYIGSYSGFIRAKMSRRLKHSVLSGEQCDRLHAHFTTLVVNEARSQEFAQYIGLWRRFITPTQLQA